MEIYLIRHTTPQIEKGICYGQSDIDLADTFLEEYQTIIKKVSSKKNSKIISSPLKRCTLLAKQFNNTFFLDDRLKELNFGNWELTPWNSIDPKVINPWMEDFVNVTVPNGESYVDLNFRVNAFFDELALSNETKNQIIITHAGPIRAFLSKLLNLELKDSFNIKINYGDVFHLRKENNTYKLITPINL